MTSDEALELAVHRALRAEVPPCVRAIVAAKLSADGIVLHVFHTGPASQLANFEETVESELEECLPSALEKAPQLSCKLFPAEEFEARAGWLIVHNNPWAGS